MRIASLLPSATEIVCALGAQSDLVGVSHECDFPPGVEKLPVLTRTRKTLPRASGAIDRAVRAILEDALTVYELDLPKLRETAPQIIVTQDLCDVCAVSLDDVRKALAELARADVEIVSLKPLRLADVWDDVRRVGTALGERERGERVARALEQRCADLRHAQQQFAIAERLVIGDGQSAENELAGGDGIGERLDILAMEMRADHHGLHRLLVRTIASTFARTTFSPR
jgi:ABC-type hemin transport system substrate-binding protein